MAKSKVSINADEFVKNLSKAGLGYHMDIMTGFTRHLDNARMRAGDKYIIPRKAGLPRTKAGFRRLYKLQPSHPKMLTERTGFLKKILKSVGAWKITKKIARLKADPHLLFWVRPQRVGKRRLYIARASITEKGDSEVKYRVAHEKHGDKSGLKRPFFEPALMDEKQVIAKMLKANIYKLRIA